MQWTQEELTILKEHYKEKGKNIASLLPKRTCIAIKIKASHLQIKRRDCFRDPWTPEELAILKERWKEKGKDVCSLLPNRTWSAIGRMASILHLKRKEVDILPPLNLEDWQKAWLACAIDSEGMISIHTGGNPFRHFNPIIRVANTSINFLEYVKALVGGGRIKLCRKSTSERKTLWYWYLLGYSNIHRLLSLILPYFIIKKERADLVIKFCDSRLRRRKKSGYYLPLSSEERAIIMRVKVLNS